jgi:hypothetical protein
MHVSVVAYPAEYMTGDVLGQSKVGMEQVNWP